ncbi:2-dehydro-3-deoxygluconokinase [Enterococcus florum]|uniref:2-dehydro-3-deoxygluconokinase n=1 Tax=Enterococcus florum TaxID=2480627 RepID=A0A4P5PBW9_9ENTE|nr:sugar kinase [Enterococcus florum]GCF93781.1 2-dehydro-3-deoxygluconokinase [Enterococcus florum]
MGKVVTLGEIMLRLSTTVGERISTSRSFQAHYGGGEANVAVSLANFGHQVTFATKVPDNSLGMTVIQQIRRAGVDPSSILVGGPRLGTYYLEAGIGSRAAKVIYDRAGSSFAEICKNEWPDDLLEGADILHLSGITAALSPQWCELLIEFMQLAHQKGCKVSFDINYRGNLWSQAAAGDALARLLPHVDYCSAGKLDAIYLLGIEERASSDGEVMDYYQAIQEKYPSIELLYSTKRVVHSASSHELTGTLWQNGYYESVTHRLNPIVDRVGGGDAFSAGILHGLLTGKNPQELVDFATAAAALKHTVHGDANLFTAQEVEAYMSNGSGVISR